MTNDQILANLHRKQNMFSEMYKALQKAQEESVEIEQWQAKLKELDEAKAQATTYATQLQDALKRIVDLSAFKTKLEEKIGAFAKDLLDRDKLILLKDKQIAGLSQELDSFRQAVSSWVARWAIGRGEQRSRSSQLSHAHAHTHTHTCTHQALQEAQELRARESEILKANKRYANDLRVAKERVEELEAELGELKEDREKETKQSRAAISKLTTANEKAEQRVEALESEKKNISKHVWNLTDEIKVQSAKLGEAEEELQLVKSKASKADKAHQASSKKLKKAIAELGKALTLQKAKTNEAEERIVTLENEAHEKEKAFEDGQKQVLLRVRTLQEAIAQNEKTIDSKERLLEAADKRVESERAARERQARDLKEKIEKLAKEKKALETQLSRAEDLVAKLQEEFQGRSGRLDEAEKACVWEGWPTFARLITHSRHAYGWYMTDHFTPPNPSASTAREKRSKSSPRLRKSSGMRLPIEKRSSTESSSGSRPKSSGRRPLRSSCGASFNRLSRTRLQRARSS